MPSPVGHTLAALAICRLWNHSRSPIHPDWRSTIAIVVAANLPDIDALSYFLGERSSTNGWLVHRGPLHSLGAALILGALVFVVLQRGGMRFAVRWAGILGSVYASHVLLDYFNADPGAPRGVPMFWPISGSYHISPVTIFLNIEWRDRSTWITWHHLAAVAIEVMVLLPFVLVHRTRIRDRDGDAFATGLGVAESSDIHAS